MLEIWTPACNWQTRQVSNPDEPDWFSEKSTQAQTETYGAECTAGTSTSRLKIKLRKILCVIVILFCRGTANPIIFEGGIPEINSLIKVSS